MSYKDMYKLTVKTLFLTKICGFSNPYFDSNFDGFSTYHDESNATLCSNSSILWAHTLPKVALIYGDSIPSFFGQKDDDRWLK